MRLSLSMVMDWIGDLAKKVEVVDPEGTSHILTVESREAERMVFPGEIISVAVIARVCARSVSVGVMREAVGASVGRSAGRMVSVKSMPAVSSTREEGKKRREETALRWGFARILRLGFARVG